MNRIYVAPTSEWYIERAVWLISGIVLLTSTALAWLVNPCFIVLVACTGLTSIWVGSRIGSGGIVHSSEQ